MQYVITKSSRIPTGPYSGPSCEAAGVPENKIYDSKEEAIADAKKLSAVNPVGFKVWSMEDVAFAEAEGLFIVEVGKILDSKSILFTYEMIMASEEYFAQTCVDYVPGVEEVKAIAEEFVNTLQK